MKEDSQRPEKSLRGPTGMRRRTSFTDKEAAEIARVIGLDLKQAGFDLEQFRMGLDTELEHGRRNPVTNVTNDNPVTTGRIALAHLMEIPDYYTRLKKMEEEAGVTGAWLHKTF